MAKNKYKIINDYVIIYLNRKDGTVLETIIDLEEMDKVLGYKYKWYPHYFKNTKTFYAYSTVYNGSPNQGFKNGTIRLNNFIMDFPVGVEIDHIDHDTLNNRKSNMRISEFSENSKHRRTRNSNNKSGYRNVCLIDGKWVIQLQINGKNTRLKSFPFEQLDEAGVYAELKRKEFYGEFDGNN